MGHRWISNTIPYLVPIRQWYNAIDFYFLKDGGCLLVNSTCKISYKKIKISTPLRVSEVSNYVEIPLAK